jgi:hypothetical protein
VGPGAREGAGLPEADADGARRGGGFFGGGALLATDGGGGSGGATVEDAAIGEVLAGSTDVTSAPAK